MNDLSALMCQDRGVDRAVAVVDGEVRTLAQLQSAVASLAADICALNAPAVFLFADCSYLFTVGLFAALHSGCPVTVLPNCQPALVQTAVTEGALFLTDADDVIGVKVRDLRRPAQGHGVPLSALDAERAAIAFYTSGSSGQAKLIEKTLHQLAIECRLLEGIWGYGIGAVPVYGTVSHQHIYGLLFRVLWPLLVGRPFVAQLYLYWESLEADFTPGAMLISSPAHLSRIPFVEKDAARLSPVAVFSSGGPLSFAAAQDAKAHLGDYPWEVYGSTETGGVAYRQQSQEGKAWQRFDDVTFEILPEGTLGLRSSRLSDDALFETSDLVDLIDEDRFVLKGRADRLVKVEGKRVSLIEVETVLQADPRIAEAYCVLLKDPSLQLAVVVELSATGQQAMVELGPFRMSRDLRKQAAAQLEAAALPKRWRFVEQIPQNAQGKRPLGDILRLFEGLQAKEGPVIDPEILDYRWIDQGVELDLRAPADLHYFKGHFPDVPVLPGVAQLDWAVRYARDAFGGFGAVTEVSQLKYRRLWTPSESVTLRLLHKVEKQAVTFSFATAQAVFSSGTFKVATQ